jgi:hypothetical protein
MMGVIISIFFYQEDEYEDQLSRYKHDLLREVSNPAAHQPRPQPQPL